MSLDFVERFFKLTLDNVYRFACSLLFIAAMFASARGLRPSQQVMDLLDWLGIPSSWLRNVAEWLGARQEVCATVAGLVLIVAIAFAATNNWRGRSGSTALLSTVILVQTGAGPGLFASVVSVLATLAATTILARLVARRLGCNPPSWTHTVSEGAWSVFNALFIAAAHLLSPLGWLISQDPDRTLGSLWSPLHVEIATPTGPSGAKRPS